MRRLDLTGQRFGRLTVLYSTSQVRHGHYDVVCRCKCGEITTVASNHLRLGRTISCGCFRLEQLRKAEVNRGEKQWKHKLTAEDVRTIRALRSRGYLQREIATEFGVTRTAISAVLRGINWRHVS